MTTRPHKGTRSRDHDVTTRHEPQTHLDDATLQMLEQVSTASLSSQLQSRGYQNSFFNGLRPLNDDQRMIGVARTLRYLPHRPDMASVLGTDVQRDTVESLQPGEVLVIDARDEPHAGTIGDIYASRAKCLGAAGIVTDGALRDTPAIKGLGIAVYHQSSNASTFGRRHFPCDSQIPVCCAGAAVFPGDVIVGDGEGALVIPVAIVHEVAESALATEIEEEFVLEKVSDGASTIGYFPLEVPQRDEYEAWLDQREGRRP